MKKLMIYGATGDTGRLAASCAKEAGLDIVIAGRDGIPLAALATTLNVESRQFALDNDDDSLKAFDGIAVLLNCAGPFHRTAKPMMQESVLH